MARKVIAEKMLKENGKVIQITKVHKGLGTFEGEECDLIEYLDEGQLRLIEAPLVELK